MAWHSSLVRLRQALRLRPPQARTDHFFALSLDMLCITTLDGRFLKVNPALTRTLGYAKKELLSKNILDLLHPDDRRAAAPSVADLARGNPIAELESRWRCADGSDKWVIWSTSPSVSEGLAYTVAHDRTRQKTDEQALREADERCACAIESTTDAFFAIDHDWRLLRVNQQTERLLARSRIELLGRILWEVFPEPPGGPFHRIYEKALRSGTPVHGEELYPHSQHDRWFEVHAYPSEDGLAVYFRDVTDRRHFEEKIQRSLQEKEVLLREVHHRVKNNLQIICSMLRLQSRNIQDEAMLQALRDCRERVQAMAMLHDQLHRARDFSNINLGEYIRNLAASLFCSYGVNSTDIGLRTDVEDMNVSIDTAIPCGLIVNELVSNSLRHAFPNGRKGHIWLGLAARSNGNAELTARDDGRGFPGSAASTRSLGLRLVELLAEQIDARLERSSTEAGTAYWLTFQAAQAREVESHEQTPHPVGRG